MMELTDMGADLAGGLDTLARLELPSGQFSPPPGQFPGPSDNFHPGPPQFPATTGQFSPGGPALPGNTASLLSMSAHPW